MCSSDLAVFMAGIPSLPYSEPRSHRLMPSIPNSSTTVFTCATKSTICPSVRLQNPSPFPLPSIEIQTLLPCSCSGRMQRRVRRAGISIHALREEGDRGTGQLQANERGGFLSTPSARRATADNRKLAKGKIISIHALREEGDNFRT